MSVYGYSVFDVASRMKALDFSTILFVAQWVLLLIVVFIFYFKFLGRKREEARKNKIISPNILRKRDTGTDLDTLYDILEKKENMKVSDIGKSFGISNDKALDWAKILENDELVSIEYPAFSEPEVKIKRGEYAKEKEAKETEEKEGKKEIEEKGKEEIEGKEIKEEKSKKRRKKRKAKKK